MDHSDEVEAPFERPWLFHTVQLEARRARQLCNADFRRRPFSPGGAPKERGRNGHFWGLSLRAQIVAADVPRPSARRPYRGRAKSTASTQRIAAANAAKDEPFGRPAHDGGCRAPRGAENSG